MLGLQAYVTGLCQHSQIMYTVLNQIQGFVHVRPTLYQLSYIHSHLYFYEAHNLTSNFASVLSKLFDSIVNFYNSSRKQLLVYIRFLKCFLYFAPGSHFELKK